MFIKILERTECTIIQVERCVLLIVNVHMYMYVCMCAYNLFINLQISVIPELIFIQFAA